MIAVLGLYRGGSSTVAGVLHRLGVCMGHTLKVVPESADSARYCTYEDWHLREACLRCYFEPSMDARKGFAGRVQVLRDYLAARKAGEHATGRESRDTTVVDGCDCKTLGAKFPTLCAMGPELVEAWPGVRFVSVQRDPVVVADSLQRWYADRAEGLTDELWAARERFLRERDYVAVSYDRLCDAPEWEVRDLADRLGLSPTPEQLANAAAFVCKPVAVGGESWR